MGRLVYFELIKAVKSKFLLAALVSFLLQCGIQEYQDYVRGMRETDLALPVETFFEYVGEERSVTRFQQEQMEAFNALTAEEYADAVDALKEVRRKCAHRLYLYGQRGDTAGSGLRGGNE